MYLNCPFPAAIRTPWNPATRHSSICIIYRLDGPEPLLYAIDWGRLHTTWGILCIWTILFGLLYVRNCPPEKRLIKCGHYFWRKTLIFKRGTCGEMGSGKPWGRGIEWRAQSTPQLVNPYETPRGLCNVNVRVITTLKIVQVFSQFSYKESVPEPSTTEDVSWSVRRTKESRAYLVEEK